MKSKTKYPISAVVCKYALQSKGISGRAMARLLKIDNATWFRYANGQRRPPKEVNTSLAAMMHTETFLDLVREA